MHILQSKYFIISKRTPNLRSLRKSFHCVQPSLREDCHTGFHCVQTSLKEDCHTGFNRVLASLREDCHTGFHCVLTSLKEDCHTGFHCMLVSLKEDCLTGFHCMLVSLKEDCHTGFHCVLASLKEDCHTGWKVPPVSQKIVTRALESATCITEGSRSLCHFMHHCFKEEKYFLEIRFVCIRSPFSLEIGCFVCQC